jgi:hypothetical protein
VTVQGWLAARSWEVSSAHVLHTDTVRYVCGVRKYGMWFPILARHRCVFI